MALLILFYPWSGLDYLGQVVKQGNSPPEKLVQFIKAHVPLSSLIETPEYELAFLDDDHRFHLMPSYYFVESTPKKIVLFNPRPQPYEFEQVHADVLILGRFGKGVFKQIYPPRLVARDWRRIAQVDYYDIYVRRPQLVRRTTRPKLIQKVGASSHLKVKMTETRRPSVVSH